jgi:hypothetical protein
MLDQQLVHDHAFTDLNESLQVLCPVDNQTHILTVERYNKQRHNMILDGQTIVQDQTLQITDLLIDNIPLPGYILDKHSKFCWLDNEHKGSRYFGPNGTWTFDFGTPFISWVLDEKIKHESQYSNDFQYPWSNRLGPDSVDQLLTTITQVESKVHEVL